MAGAVSRLHRHGRRRCWAGAFRSDVRRRRRTCARPAIGLLQDLLYLGVNVVLALIGLLLTTRRPEHRISWVLAITASGERSAASVRVRGRGARRGPRLSPGWACRRLVRQLVVASRARPAIECTAPAHAGRPPGIASVVAHSGRRRGGDGTRVGRRLGLSYVRARRGEPIENPLALDIPAVIAAGVVGAILVIGGLGRVARGIRSALPKVRR